MGKGRLEAFSDGVIAIIITIMVLGLKIPHETGWAAMRDLAPSLVSYALSFVFIGIYWNNHHHLLQAIHRVNGGILWANTHLLFWLSLIPFVTSWTGQNLLAPLPVALYGVVLLFAAFAYFILVRSLMWHHGEDSTLAIAVGNDSKGKISLVLYAAAIPLTMVSTWLSLGLYAVVAVIWLIPDRRIEKAMSKR